MTAHFLYPGHIHVSTDQEVIKTILGSCVAIVLWDERNKIGGMCHYLLAKAPPHAAKSGRYGTFAIQMLLRELDKVGAHRGDLIAEIYGGGSVVEALGNGPAGIGDHNIQFAEDILAKERIIVRTRNTGGRSGRRIAFDPQTGVTICDIQAEDAAISRSGYKIDLPKELVRVLIVDDSATLRTILKNVFDRSKKILVVGTATDPFDAREKIIALKPDVITLDIEMPRMNGIQFLEKLMIHQPMPVVVVSSLSSQGEAATKALQLGAVEFVHKPSQFDPLVLTDLGEILIPKVIGAASASIKSLRPPSPSQTSKLLSKPSPQKRVDNNVIKIIGISGNAGSPTALSQIVPMLAADTPPVVIASSTIAGFAATWISQHQKQCSVQIELAQDGQVLQQGRVYIAHGDRHIQVKRQGETYVLSTLKAPPALGQRPSGDILFESILDAAGANTLAVLLSGFGRDGIAGLTSLRDTGAWTICQEPGDCTFNFAPAAAIDQAVACAVVPAASIAEKIYERRSTAVT